MQRTKSKKNPEKENKTLSAMEINYRITVVKSSHLCMDTQIDQQSKTV